MWKQQEDEEEEWTGTPHILWCQTDLSVESIDQTIDTPGWLLNVVRDISSYLKRFNVIWSTDALQHYGIVLRNVTQYWIPYNRFDYYDSFHHSNQSGCKVSNDFRCDAYDALRFWFFESTIACIYIITEHHNRMNVVLENVKAGVDAWLRYHYENYLRIVDFPNAYFQRMRHLKWVRDRHTGLKIKYDSSLNSIADSSAESVVEHGANETESEDDFTSTE